MARDGPDQPQATRVVAPIEPVELQPGTSLRYEYLSSGRDYWGGYTVYGEDRRFLVLDGEHAGARVMHTESRWFDDSEREDLGDLSGDPFPPPGLEAAEERSASEPETVAQDHP